ncbi:MAG: S-adenosylmethionine decarboxylase proenzyme [Planctomycetes bacterium]|nr:S-adenosylmethionine decarboxylase proenzyme [Planctomycetota bacterium]
MSQLKEVLDTDGHRHYSEEEKAAAFGFHLMLDCYECDPAHLDDISHCYSFLDELVAKIGAEKQTQPYVFRTPAKFKGKEGLSGWVPIVESGISIHTLTQSRFVSIDVYSCREFDNNRVAAFAKTFFGPGQIEMTFLLRGRRYCPSS